MTDQPTPQAPTIPFTIHSSGKEYFRRFGIGRVILLLFLFAILFLRFDAIVAVPTTIALVVGISIGLWRMLYHRSVTFEADRVIYRNGLGGAKEIPYDSIGELIGAVRYLDMTFGSIPRLTLTSKEGKPLLSLYGLYWGAGDLEKASLALEAKQVKALYVDQPISSFEFAKRFPNHAGQLEKHPVRYAFIITFVLVFGIAAIVLLLDYLN